MRCLALVGHRISVCIVGDLELVDQIASHVIHFEVDSAREVLEVQVHLPVVGVRSNRESPRICRKTILFHAIERTDEPIAAFDALRIAFVVYFGAEPYGVIYMI